MLYFIGIGLNDEKDITLKGLEAVRQCDFVYLENYTSKLQCSFEKLDKLYGKKIILADRDVVEKEAEDTILKHAKSKKVAFLVIGDVFGATTHADLMIRAKEKKIKYEIINNTSVLNAVGVVGLELYKYGKVTSIPFDNENVITPYQVLKSNKKMGLHTLFLLDLKVKENKFLTIKEAIEFLKRVESKENGNLIDDNTMAIACARLGSSNKKIVYSSLKKLTKMDFGESPYCLIIPGKIHFIEEEVLELWKK